MAIGHSGEIRWGLWMGPEKHWTWQVWNAVERDDIKWDTMIGFFAQIDAEPNFAVEKSWGFGQTGLEKLVIWQRCLCVLFTLLETSDDHNDNIKLAWPITHG
eukprot:EG_transcript_50410